MKRILLAVAVLLLAACSEKTSQQTASIAPEKTIDWVAQAPKPPEPPATPPPPVHLYSLEEDGEYGYERDISEDDEKAGKKTSPLIMVRYLGDKDGSHTVRMVKGAISQTYSCKEPCEFVKSTLSVNGQPMETETMRAAEGSIIWAIMQDVQRGMLRPYASPKKRAG